MRQKLGKYPHFAAQAGRLSKDAADLVQVIKAMPDGTNKMDLRTAYADSLKTVWIVMCALAAVAMVASLWTRHYDLDRALSSEQQLQQQKKTSRDGVAEEGMKVEI